MWPVKNWKHEIINSTVLGKNFVRTICTNCLARTFKMIISEDESLFLKNTTLCFKVYKTLQMSSFPMGLSGNAEE